MPVSGTRSRWRPECSAASARRRAPRRAAAALTFVVAVGCAGSDPSPAADSGAFLAPENGRGADHAQDHAHLAGAEPDTGGASGAAAAGGDHAHAGVVAAAGGAGGAAADIEHAHLAGPAGDHHHASPPALADGASFDAERLVAAQQQILDGLGPAATPAGPETGTPGAGAAASSGNAAGGPTEDLEPLNVTGVEVAFLPVLPGGGGEELLDDEAALERFVLAHGPAAAVAELKALELATGRDCHSAAHEVGHVSYENYGAAAYTLAAHDCHSGVLHGIIESLIADRGTSRLAADVAALCSSAGNSFLVHQCFHGVGHGLLAWTTYELPEALLLCDEMPSYADRDACYGGVHMENGVGGLSGLMGHTTEYLDPERPHFPCDVLPEHHVPGCYFWQTSNLFWFGYEAPAVARLCLEAPVYAHESCWWSMGRDLGSIHRASPAAAAELCKLAPDVEHLTDCFQGAALSRFTEAANAPFSARLCAVADVEHPLEVAEGCWEMVLRDAPHILGDAAAKQSFCESLAVPLRRDRCLEAMLA